MTLDVVFHENKGRVQADPGLPKPAYHTVSEVCMLAIHRVWVTPQIMIVTPRIMVTQP